MTSSQTLKTQTNKIKSVSLIKARSLSRSVCRASIQSVLLPIQFSTCLTLPSLTYNSEYLCHIHKYVSCVHIHQFCAYKNSSPPLIITVAVTEWCRCQESRILVTQLTHVWWAVETKLFFFMRKTSWSLKKTEHASPGDCDCVCEPAARFSIPRNA